MINFTLCAFVYMSNFHVLSNLLLIYICKLQYYNGRTGEVSAVPTTPEHSQLLERYSSLVGRKQTILDSFESCLRTTLSAKLLILCSDPEALMDLARVELDVSKWNMIRGSDYFVEFLPASMSKGIP
jgi:hypothetical protein